MRIARAHLVDRFDTSTLVMVVILLCLSIVDGALTIELLEINIEEANPLMAYLLKRGPLTFLLGKYFLTAMGLPFIVVYKNYPMFGTRFHGFLLPVFIGLYVGLIAYQGTLFQMGGAQSPNCRHGCHRRREPPLRPTSSKIYVDLERGPAS